MWAKVGGKLRGNEFVGSKVPVKKSDCFDGFFFFKNRSSFLAVQLATNFCPHVCLRLPFAMLVASMFAAAFASEVFLPRLLALFLQVILPSP